MTRLSLSTVCVIAGSHECFNITRQIDLGYSGVLSNRKKGNLMSDGRTGTK
jgi:hypothetical protein